MLQSVTTRLLLALLLADLGFMVLHLMEDIGPFWRKAFRMDQDNSFAEFFQYAKAIGSGVVLALMARAWRSGLLWLASGLAWFLFLDDAFRIHEQLGGGVIGRLVTGDESMQGYHLGQLWYALAVGAVIVVIFLFAWRGATGRARRVVAGFLACIAGLGFAAIFIDAIPTTLIAADWFRPAIGLLEEAGEHVALTAALWWSVHCWLAAGRPGYSLG